jgi:transposase InsO family protein
MPNAQLSCLTESSPPAAQSALGGRADIDGLFHHSQGGSQYLSICHTERLAEAGVELPLRSVGGSYGNAVADTVIGLCKTEVINRRGSWRNVDAVEFATLEWVGWLNNRRLELRGNIPPVEL